jgi:hypothetical protein
MLYITFSFSFVARRTKSPRKYYSVLLEANLIFFRSIGLHESKVNWVLPHGHAVAAIVKAPASDTVSSKHEPFGDFRIMPWPFASLLLSEIVK